MLIDFSFSNFKSYRDGQQFSMRRLTNAQKHDSASWPDSSISTVAGIYGGNASGKSAFMEAFRFVADFIRQGFDPNYDVNAHLKTFALDSVSRNEPSGFLVEFVGTDDRRYTYEFSLLDGRVDFETLRVYEANRSSRIFEREYLGELGYSYKYGRAFSGTKRTFEQMTREDRLYLSALYAANIGIVKPACDLFRQRLGFYEADLFGCELNNLVGELKNGTPTASALTALMSRADLGISVVQTKDLLAELQASSQRPGDPREGGYADLASGMLALSQPQLSREERRQRAQSLAKKPLGPLYEFTFTHKGADGFEASFSQDEESRGTLAVLAFFSLALRLLSKRSVGFIDEIDSSLHPSYVEELVALFKDPRTNPHQSQLVFTTHDVSLITRTGADRRVLDQDQIWLVEKGGDGASSIYPVTALQTRWDENFGRNYLHGVYGASPRPGFHEAFADAVEELEGSSAEFTASEFGGGGQ